MIWVAEIGSMHQGNKSLAYELIRKAKWAGATIAKFQLGWTPEAETRYATRPAPLREDHKCSARNIDDWVDDLAKWCADMDIEFMASIWSMEGLKAARSVGMKRYKIAHQMRDGKLGRAILSDGREVFISGECLKKDHQQIRGILSDYRYPVYPTDKFSTIKGYNYGGWNHDIGISHMEGTTLVVDATKFVRGGGYYGFSSHRHGIADALIAVDRGARYIEKHLTLDKTLAWPRDASFALVPTEFRQMVDVGTEIARLR